MRKPQFSKCTSLGYNIGRLDSPTALEKARKISLESCANKTVDPIWQKLKRMENNMRVADMK